MKAEEIDLELLILKASSIAHKQPFNGHLTIFKFTTNWRVSLGTPYDDKHVRDFIDYAIEGKTLRDALKAFIQKTEGQIWVG